MATPTKTKRSEASGRKVSVRKDGRTATLVYMKPDILEAAQEAAASDNLKSWEFIERAVKQALASRKRKATKAAQR